MMAELQISHALLMSPCVRRITRSAERADALDRWREAERHFEETLPRYRDEYARYGAAERERSVYRSLNAAMDQCTTTRRNFEAQWTPTDEERAYVVAPSLPNFNPALPDEAM